MPAKKPERVAVIGGGIAGLFCAYLLSQEGREVELFESSEVLGGRIRSFRFNPATLNDLERKPDDDRTPIKDEATLEKALHPELLQRSPDVEELLHSLTKQGKQGTAKLPKRWAFSHEEPLQLEDPDPKKTIAPADRVKYFSVPEYDKRLWDGLEFNAEFGPMRIELQVQRLLGFLLEGLKIPGINEGPPKEVSKASDLVRMQRFPAFSSPASAGDPTYDLTPEEQGKNPLELLKLGLCRAVVDLRFDEKADPLNDPNKPDAKKHKRFITKHEHLVDQLAKAAATQRSSGPIFESWVRNQLGEDDLWIIQRYGQIPVVYGAEEPIKLHTMGFWNLLAAYLSHNALSKIRELGTFYHLIPENPNAAEWLTWWLRQVSISSTLEGVFGGMQSVVEKLTAAAGVTLSTGTKWKDSSKPNAKGGSLVIYRKATVTDLKRPAAKSARISITLEKHAEPPTEPFDRVILALPTIPAKKLIQSCNLWGTSSAGQTEKNRFLDHLHAALPFQLLKVFFVVRERWWEEDVRANLGATRYPTREVYFWKSRIRESRRGLIMLYTDRPAAAFWANYLPEPTQEDIDELCRPTPLDKDAKVVKTLRARIKSRFVEYVNENEGVKISPDDIIWCGIMDWGREPYGAASHTWRPNRPYWETLAKLAHWKVQAGSGPQLDLHVCGEAYSDYHAFIEGALRSAVHVLTLIGGAENDHDKKNALLRRILADLIGPERAKAIFAAAAEARARDEGADRTEGANGAHLDKDGEYIADFLDWSVNLDSYR